MTRLNPLPPSMRERERWVVFRVIMEGDDPLPLNKAVNTIWKACMENFGTVGCAKFMLWVPSNLYDEKKRAGIIRCTSKTVENLRFALSTIKEVDGKPAVFHVLGVSGTIKRAKKKFLEKVLKQTAVTHDE